MLGEVLAGYANVRVDEFDGLLVDFCARTTSRRS
jgi:phosphopantetheine adenylyltransferase